MLNFPLSTFYYKPKEPDRNKEIQEADIKDQLEKIICGFPGYGSRLVTAQLKREGWIINRKRIQRIMRENELLCVVKRKKNWMNYSQNTHRYYPNIKKNVVIDNINQVWGAEITYIRILRGFVFLAIVLDLHSRKILG